MGSTQDEPMPLSNDYVTAPLPDDLQDYQFPTNRLKRTLEDPTKTPLVLVACGSFSPPTFLHLRMFEMALDYVKINTDFEIVGGYLSPVSDAYKKAGLASAEHRIRMCSIGAETSTWLDVDNWEAGEFT
ncbi:nicotinamide mononucleotide adenylyltransferase, partial [Lecanoromycetidae sp. Uapishka_2]